MNLSTTSEQINSPLDWLKWVLVWVLLAGLFTANYYLSSQSVSLRIAADLLAGIVVLAFASFTDKGKRFWIFAKNATIELRKVVWPTRQETTQSTIMIIIVVVIAALFLWGVDTFLLWAVSFFTGQRG